LDLGVRKGLSLYTGDRARGAVDAILLVPEGENSIIDAPAKKQQKGDFIFRCAPHPTPPPPPFFFSHHITGCAEVPDFGALRWPVDWLVGNMSFLLMWQPRTGLTT
jgi:hypothetical protein